MAAAEMHQDEKVIRSGYQQWLAPWLGLVPLAAAYFLDLKWVVAISATVLIYMGHENGGRLHDLCIRLRRATLLLAELRDKR